jgi:hypothetical protein
MMVSFGITFISSIFLCLFDKGTSHEVLYAVVLCLAKGGATLNFGYAYTIHQELFPQYFMITSYGVCNFFCRGLTMFAPIVAEVPKTLFPYLFCVCTAFVGLLSSSLLKK